MCGRGGVGQVRLFCGTPTSPAGTPEGSGSGQSAETPFCLDCETSAHHIVTCIGPLRVGVLAWWWFGIVPVMSLCVRMRQLVHRGTTEGPQEGPQEAAVTAETWGRAGGPLVGQLQGDVPLDSVAAAVCSACSGRMQDAPTQARHVGLRRDACQGTVAVGRCGAHHCALLIDAPSPPLCPAGDHVATGRHAATHCARAMRQVRCIGSRCVAQCCRRRAW
jgi:hypothetical protein